MKSSAIQRPSLFRADSREREREEDEKIMPSLMATSFVLAHALRSDQHIHDNLETAQATISTV